MKSKKYSEQSWHPEFKRKYLIDERNDKKPFKLIAKGSGEPMRFTNKEDAFVIFGAMRGPAILTHNTNDKQTVLAYKYR